ncbi:MAG: hypothetical protein ORN51_09855 [Akkermansiaceae bacterium]|nr:hypothetical protein [Akkermansiaceae bacterium]
MARERKKISLRTVEEAIVQPTPVTRIENRETQRQPKPVRIEILDSEQAVSQRLELPDTTDQDELRTHQPGVEALEEQILTDTGLIEQSWASESDQEKNIPWAWFALIALILAAGLAWSLSLINSSSPKIEEQQNAASSIYQKNLTEEQEAERLVSQIENASRNFLKASSIDEMIPFIRHAERVTPLMRTFYASNPIDHLQVKNLTQLQPVTLDERAIFWQVSFETGPEKITSLLVEVLKSGEVKIDWETYAHYQPMDWDVFAKKRPAGSTFEFRVYIEPDNFYSYEFKNSNVWNCYKLTALGKEETLFGYVKAGSETAETLAKLVAENSNQKVAGALRIHIPIGIESKLGVVIEKVIAPRWIYLDSPVSDN